ncbi:MAG: hypothetical protein ACTSRW_05930 [Candidatus Helarchaeota archaeon]
MSSKWTKPDLFDGEDISLSKEELEKIEKRRRIKIQVYLGAFFTKLMEILKFRFWEVEFKKNEQETLIFEPTGFFLERKIEKNGEILRTKNEIYMFEFFDCYRIIEYDDYENNEFICHIQIDEKRPLLNLRKSKQELRKFLDENCFVGKTYTLARLFPKIFERYLAVRRPESIKISKVIGFTREYGWALPPSFIPEESSEIQSKIYKKMFEIMRMRTTETVKNKFKMLYNAISVEYKDICFAWAFSAPFFYALKPISYIVPYLIFISSEHNTGKTQMANLLTGFIYNGMEMLSSSNMKSDSRFADYFTVGTFPIAIDEIQDFQAEHIDKLKAAATSEIFNTKKRVDQKIRTDKPYQCASIFTCNSLPQSFSDPTFLSRCILIRFDKKFSDREQKEYQNAKSKIRPGEIFNYFYHKTRDLKYADIEKIFYDAENLNGLKGRDATIFRLLNIGRVLIKKVFDIELNISENFQDILDERVAYSWDNQIFESFISYISLQYGKISDCDSHGRYSCLKAEFLYKLKTTGIECIIQAINRAEMKNIFLRDRDISHDDLKRILRDRGFKVSKSDTHRWDVGRRRGIRVFIPFNVFNDVYDEIRDSNEEDGIKKKVFDIIKKHGPIRVRKINELLQGEDINKILTALKILYEKDGIIYQPKKDVYEAL